MLAICGLAYLELWVVEYLQNGFVSPFFLCQKFNNQIMEKLKTFAKTIAVVSVLGATLGHMHAQSQSAFDPQVYRNIETPTMFTLGTENKILFGSWVVRPFATFGAYAMPNQLKYSYHSTRQHNSERIMEDYETPRVATSVGGGLYIFIANRNTVNAKPIPSMAKLIPFINIHYGAYYRRTKFGIRWDHSFELSPNRFLGCHIGLYVNGLEFSNINPRFSQYGSSAGTGGLEFGLIYEQKVSSRLYLMTRVNYAHNSSYRESEWAYPREISASVGLVYNLSLNLSGFEPRERTPRQPRMQQVRPAPTHRQIQVPCPAHKSNYRPASNIFNRP